MNQETLVSALVPSQARSFVVFAAEVDINSLALKRLVAGVDTTAVEQLAILRIVEHIQSTFPGHSSGEDIAALFMLLFLFETFTRNTMPAAAFGVQN